MSEIPAAQGCAAIFLSHKRLKYEEKHKITFCVFRALISQDDLFRDFLAV